MKKVTRATDTQDAPQQPEKRFRSLIEKSLEGAELERQKLENFFMQAPAIINIMEGPEHVITFANPGFYQVTGKKEHEVLGKTVQEAQPELAGQGIYELLDHVYQTGEPFYGTEIPVKIERNGNGQLEQAYFNFTYQPLRGIDGQIESLMSFAVEVTEQVKAKQALQESEERFRTLADNIPNLAWIANADGWIFWYNSRWYDYTGMTPEQMEGWGWQSVHDPNQLSHVLERWQQSIQTGEPFDMVFPLKGADGIFRPFLTRVMPVKDTNGTVTRWFGTNTDITQQKQAEEAQRRLAADLAFLAEASKALSSSLDTTAILNAIPNLAVPYVADYCTVHMLNEQGVFDLVAIAQKDPENGVVSFGTSAISVPLIVQGKAIGTITFVTFETDKRANEADRAMIEELVRRASLAIENAGLYTDAQKAIALRDEFIAVASHELKTPITSLKMYTQVLQKQLARKSEETSTAQLTKMNAQIDKLTLLIGDLLDVAKIALGKLAFREEAFDLNELVKETVEHIQSSVTKHTIQIEGRIGQPVWGDRDRIGQVVTNLLTNAIRYSPQAGAVIVRLTPEQDEAVVSVQDFGIGIAQEHHAHLFTRFYRVNDSEEKTFPGLGIGLYIAHDIITRHGGMLTVASEKGQGSLFRFTLPYRARTQDPPIFI